MMSENTSQLAHANLLLQTEMERLLAAERCLSAHNAALSRCIGEHKRRAKGEQLSPESLVLAAAVVVGEEKDNLDGSIMKATQALPQPLDLDTERANAAEAACMAVEALRSMGTVPCAVLTAAVAGDPISLPAVGSLSFLQTGEFGFGPGHFTGGDDSDTATSTDGSSEGSGIH